jgi:hypothetical protein
MTGGFAGIIDGRFVLLVIRSGRDPIVGIQPGPEVDEPAPVGTEREEPQMIGRGLIRRVHRLLADGAAKLSRLWLLSQAGLPA